MSSKVEMSLTLGMMLLKKLCKESKDNFVFSPMSLGTAFAMLVAGLKGDTKKELLTLLDCADEATLHEMYSDFVKNKNLPIKIANKYLAQQDYKVKDDFDKLLKEKYESEVEIVNFAKDAAKIEGEVNTWVASKTNDMIKQLLCPGTLQADTVLVLLNAVYFKGTWLNEFEPLPYEMDFKLRDGTKVKKNFMTKKSSDFKYLETEHLKMVKIPYQEGGCYMIVAIPSDENTHIDEVLSNIHIMDVAQAVEKLNNAKGPKVVLTMPKFKIDYKYGNIVEHMKAIGVNKIFSPGDGDFGDLFEKMVQSTSMSRVVHETFVEVNEEGLNATTTTAFPVRTSCCALQTPPPEIYYDLDRDFGFMIGTEDQKCILGGIIHDPTD
ncbi:putative serpin-Z12-like [Tropilaelaps mercedesae]|uniref:Putative serpin-Z12-like n=1 Tax=Tropilaelaps mercedesae TaxID=418985 RepID=A0A1V9WYW4_9ACAR|nr:putative serpin-Z12-like [Tropilaelaps mercedesae]